MSEKLEPKLGRSRSRGPRAKRSYLSAILYETSGGRLMHRPKRRLFKGTRIGRGAVAAGFLKLSDRYSGLRSRRAIVRTSYFKLQGRGLSNARDYLSYIKRGSYRSEHDPGQLYSATDDDADSKAFMRSSRDDRHNFRLIVSPDHGVEYDHLRGLVRRFMSDVEKDLGTGLQWIAGDHFDTMHPHCHIMLKGTDDRGGNLVISPEYMNSGFAHRMAEIVSIDLGPETDFEVERRRLVEIGAERLTSLDISLLDGIREDRVVKEFAPQTFDQAMRIGRLKKLASLGLAQDLGKGRWRLDEGLERVLQELGERRKITDGLGQSLSFSNTEQATIARAVARFRNETGFDFLPGDDAISAEGRIRSAFDLKSGRYALVENGQSFTLVPWRNELEREFDLPAGE